MYIITSRSLKDPRIPSIMTITQISISKDMHYAHIYFSMIGQESEINQAVTGLNRASGFIQSQIAGKLQLRFTPKIEFRYDAKEEKAYKVEELLDTLSQERKNSESE